MKINYLEPRSCTGATVHKISFLIYVFHVDHCPKRIRWYYKIIAMQQLLGQNNKSMNRMAGTRAFISELLSNVALHKFNFIRIWATRNFDGTSKKWHLVNKFILTMNFRRINHLTVELDVLCRGWRTAIMPNNVRRVRKIDISIGCNPFSLSNWFMSANSLTRGKGPPTKQTNNNWLQQLYMRSKEEVFSKKFI